MTYQFAKKGDKFANVVAGPADQIFPSELHQRVHHIGRLEFGAFGQHRELQRLVERELAGQHQGADGAVGARHAIADKEWWNKFDIEHHTELSHARHAGDVGRAKQLINQHTDQVRTLVRELIDRAGGAPDSSASQSQTEARTR